MRTCTGSAALSLRALKIKGDPLPRWYWRPMLIVLGSVIAFGLVVTHVGLVLSTIGLVFASSTASPEFRPKEALISGILFAALAAGVSHELRTPMTSIKGAIDLVLSGFAGEVSAEMRELLAIGQKNCERLIRLVNEMLDIAKIEAGKVKLKLESMDPSIPVEDAVRAVASFAGQHGVKVVMEGQDGLPSAVLDKDRIEQVVINLLSNAIKFSPDNGEVRVRVACDGFWFQCSVIDQGCGIAEPDLPKVFGKFQQVGDSWRMGGSGLGLAIAKGLIGEHSGKIWVESQVGRGSCFSFRIPLGGQERKAESAEAVASPH